MTIEVKENIFWDTDYSISEQTEDAKNWISTDILPNIIKLDLQYDEYNRPYKLSVTGEYNGVNWRVDRIREYQEGNKSWALHKIDIIVNKIV